VADQAAIAPGQLWESEIKTAVEQAVFFIPIVTRRAVSSHHCKFEFEAFLARERVLGRTDLVFPLLYIGVPALENEEQWRKRSCSLDHRHPSIRRLAAIPPSRCSYDRRPRGDWAFCDKIIEALRKPWVSPEERRKQQEIEAQQRAEGERQAEAARQAEEEKRRAEAARQAEVEISVRKWAAKYRATAVRLRPEAVVHRRKRFFSSRNAYTGPQW
jgi:hypothetical protein